MKFTFHEFPLPETMKQGKSIKKFVGSYRMGPFYRRLNLGVYRFGIVTQSNNTSLNLLD